MEFPYSAPIDNIGIHMEQCICAAILFPDGYIIRGHRHDDCIQTAIKMNKDSQGHIQGFLTTNNRFVTRTEGLKIQLDAGISTADKSKAGYGTRLYSEDLY